MTVLITTGTVARADIVWEGKRVSAWPDIAAPSARVAFAMTGFYPAPKGTVNGLTILVDFSDQAPAFTKAEVEAWLNELDYDTGESNGSVRDYFLDVSNGAVDFQNDVVGFYRAEHPKSYYEAGDGYSGSDELWAEVIDALDPMIDFSKYDNDNDGVTEAISVLYAGPAETWGQGLWPHASGSNEQRDNVTLRRYMFTAMGDQLGLYVFAHEISHMLFGWPDLYGFGDYCLMGNAQDPVDPVGINDFYRADQGWIAVTEITPETNARYSSAVNGGAFRYVNPERGSESFFWSNVQNTGRFKSLRGGGILVLHFDYDIRRNDPPNLLSLDVLEADGQGDLSKTMWPDPGSSASDFFVAGGNTLLSDTSMPPARWNDGSSTGLKLYEISASGPSMTFAVGTGTAPPEVLDGGAPYDPNPEPTDPMDSGVVDGSDAGVAADAGGSGGAGGASGGSGGTGGAPPSMMPTAGTGTGGNIAPVGGAPLGSGGTAAPASASTESSSCSVGRPRASDSSSLGAAACLALLALAARRRGYA